MLNNDPYAHPVIAEISVEMDPGDFEPDFEIRYRIQSYEGNEALDEISRKKNSNVNALLYPLTLYLE